jgi:phytoene dehydrogenase-like protein
MSSDVVVIGAGHNGLVAANYLADAGLRVEVVERRPLVGGATVTEEHIPGFRASSCSYISGLLHPKILRDLDLRSFGLHLYQTEMGSTSILPDGRHVFLYRDLGATLREIERVAPGQSEGFTEFGLRLERFAAMVSHWLLASDPPTIAEVIGAFDSAGEHELFTEFFTLSSNELLGRYVESDILEGLLTFLAIVSVWGGPHTPGWSYVYGHHAIGEFDGHMGQFAFPRGGMGSIAEALAARARSKGAQIRVDAPVERVIVEGHKARGVVLKGGDEIRADVVLSNADPQRTFSLVEDGELPLDFRTRLARYDTRGSMARVFLALDALPEFIGLPPGEGPQHRGLTLLGAEVDAFERVARAQLDGRIPDDFPIEFIIQSVHDDTMASPGQHILSTGIQQLPFQLAEGTWDDHAAGFTERVIDVLSRYTPSIRDHILGTKTITPLDLERDYGITGGNIFHGAMTLGQLFESRPLAGYGSYRTPISGLYLGGAGTHPGGGVMGAPGHNAAHAVLGDRALGGYRPSGRYVRVGGPKIPLTQRLMRRPTVRRVAVGLARQPALAPLVERLGRRQ